MRQVKKLGKRFLPLLMTILMVFSFANLDLMIVSAVSRLPNTPTQRPIGDDTPLNSGRGFGSIQRLSEDINNPTDHIIRLVTGETEYTVGMRPGIAGTTKYLYTHPSFNDAYLVGIADCPLDTLLNTVWETSNPSYPIQVPGNGGPVYLWVKYVENYPYNPTTMYFRITVMPPSSGETVYMQSLAGQSTHPPHGGQGIYNDPFTATIYLPLSKTSITNPDMTGVSAGDIEMTSEGRRFLFTNSAYMSMATEIQLSVGENHIYTAISSISQQAVQYYDVSVHRGYPFSKEADRLFYEPGDTLSYTVNWLIPQPIAASTDVRMIDSYDRTKVTFAGVSSVTSTYSGTSELLDPFSDYTVQNNPATGTLTLSFTASGKQKLLEGTQVDAVVNFTVLSSATGTIVNNARLYFNNDIFGEEEERVYQKDFEKIATPNTFTQNGDAIVYTVSFTMPDDMSDFDAVRIDDVLPGSGLAYQNQATLTTSAGTAPITMSQSGNTLYYEFPASSLPNLAGEVITLTMYFEVGSWQSGAITNTAEIYFKPAGGQYPTDPDADDTETLYPLDVTDFSKDAALGSYTPGGKIDYTVSWTLPSNAKGIYALRVVDSYDQTKVTYGGNMVVRVGGTALIANTHYTVTNDPATGTLTTVLTASGIAALLDDSLIEFAVSFDVLSSASGDIENNAKLYYNSSNDPDGEDDEIVYEDDFEKDSTLSNYAPGSRVQYTVKITLPSGVDKLNVIEVVDTYPAAYLTNPSVVSFTIGGVPLTPMQYSINPVVGAFSVKIDLNTVGHYDFRADVGKELVLVVDFIATASAQGDITNVADIYYDYEIGGGGIEIIEDNEFSKDATQLKYIPGETVDYTVSWILPEDVSTINALRIVDTYDNTLVTFNSVTSLSVGGTNLVPITDYTIVNTPTAGTLTILLSASGISKLAGDALVAVKVVFNVLPTALDTIYNNAKMFYNNNIEPDGEDNAEIELAIGPPTEVDDLPGDRKTALLWADPIGGTVAQFQVQIDNFNWLTYNLGDLIFDGTSGTSGRWYILYEFLPDGTRLVNQVEYTFRIRAISTEGYVGPIYEIKSTPGPLGDIGGRNTNLLSLYGVSTVPAGGWPIEADGRPSGTGESALNPSTNTISLPANFLHAVIHRNFVEVGQDATFVIYSDPGFTNAVEVLDRLDNSFNWLSSVTVYIRVTSSNRQLERYYAITILPQ